MKIEQLKPGQIVYDVHSYRMGNTTMRSVGVWDVFIISVDLAVRNVKASWNNNPPQTFSLRTISKWRANKPALVTIGFGQQRLQNREERAAAKLA